MRWLVQSRYPYRWNGLAQLSSHNVRPPRGRAYRGHRSIYLNFMCNGAAIAPTMAAFTTLWPTASGTCKHSV